MAGKWRAIALLGAAEVLALALWFSATAVIPVLRESYALSSTEAGLLTSLVSVGFVAGTLTSAAFGIADRFAPHRLFAAGALLAATVNLALLGFEPTHPAVLAARLLTGFAMAFVYPVGMKMAASWAAGDTGLLVGLLVGALTLGSASPHLFNALGGVDWRLTVIGASVSGVTAAMLVGFVRLGPQGGGRPRRFEARFALRAFTDPAVRLANFGYFGHMWELYAMWGWIGVFFLASFKAAALAEAETVAALATFAVLAVGALGSVVAGVLADRIGRTVVTSIAMTFSGLCAVAIGFSFGGPPLFVVALGLVWGVTVVADSAQFSSSVIELSEPELTGTMLTVQTSVGFLITLASVHLVPVWADAWGWTYAFAPLALGPAFGTVAMLRLRGRAQAEALSFR
ncbi:MAG: MFS transporter [Myxococcota bacterium]